MLPALCPVRPLIPLLAALVGERAPHDVSVMELPQ
jgi:hypothetical protein